MLKCWALSIDTVLIWQKNYWEMVVVYFSLSLLPFINFMSIAQSRKSTQVNCRYLNQWQNAASIPNEKIMKLLIHSKGFIQP